MPENQFEVIKKELAVSVPAHGNILERVLQELPPEQLQKLQQKAAEGQLGLELEQLRKVHQFKASSADIDQFIEHVKTLEMTMKNRFSTYKAEGTFTTATGTTTIQTKKHCYIATAVYGTASHPDVIFLQGFRDKHLETNVAGRSFIRFYYTVGPRLAQSALARGMCARLIRRVLTLICQCGRKCRN